MKPKPYILRGDNYKRIRRLRILALACYLGSLIFLIMAWYHNRPAVWFYIFAALVVSANIFGIIYNVRKLCKK